jgi:hypothetical protein
MRTRSIVLLAIVALIAAPAFAKRKAKDTLPAYILRAQTASVVIDPTAGFTLEDPSANQIARRDVESALTRWGRLQIVGSNQPADLIIVIRRGNKHLVTDTFPDPRQNSRAGGVSPNGDDIGLGRQQGIPPPGTPSSGDPRPSAASTQTEIAQPDDSFLVYDGKAARPLDASPAWRYTAHDALHTGTVPAVTEFRKAIDAAEKAAAQP